MTETDKLLVRIGTARDAISRKTELTSLDYMIDGVLMNCSVLLKEQETSNLYKCPNCGTWVSAENVVQCKDCKNNNKCSIQFKFADADNPGNWFCAYGKRKEV